MKKTNGKEKPRGLVKQHDRFRSQQDEFGGILQVDTTEFELSIGGNPCRLSQEFSKLEKQTRRLPTIQTLHSELAAVGLPVPGAEADGTLAFEAATESRLKEAQKLYRLHEMGTLDPVTGGVMSLAALVATELNRDRLRTALRAGFRSWI